MLEVLQDTLFQFSCLNLQVELEYFQFMILQDLFFKKNEKSGYTVKIKLDTGSTNKIFTLSSSPWSFKSFIVLSSGMQKLYGCHPSLENDHLFPHCS